MAVPFNTQTRNLREIRTSFESINQSLFTDLDLTYLRLDTTNDPLTGSLDITGSITLTGTVDGRDVATDGAKLDNIEPFADVTDETNVLAALAFSAAAKDQGGGSITNANDGTFSGDLEADSRDVLRYAYIA